MWTLAFLKTFQLRFLGKFLISLPLKDVKHREFLRLKVMEPEELKEKYVGAQCVMVTPFKEDFSVDEDGLKLVTDFLIENGVHVLQPTGSTGEFFSLTPEEHKRVIKIVVEEVGGRVPVVPGTSHSGTKMTIEMSKYAESVGADGVMIVPPYYQLPTLEGIYEHYKAVAESIKIGIVVYNNPWTSKITIGPELMRKLAEIPNIVAVKKTTRNMTLALRLLNKLGDRLTFSMGSGEELAPFYYMCGAKGHVTAIANFAPKFAVGMYEAAMRKDWDEVMKIHSKLTPYFELNHRLGEKNKGTMYISMTKEAMKMLGLPGWPPRKPLLPLHDDEREELRKVLIDMELIKS